MLLFTVHLRWLHFTNIPTRTRILVDYILHAHTILSANVLTCILFNILCILEHSLKNNSNGAKLLSVLVPYCLYRLKKPSTLNRDWTVFDVYYSGLHRYGSNRQSIRKQ